MYKTPLWYSLVGDKIAAGGYAPDRHSTTVKVTATAAHATSTTKCQTVWLYHLCSSGKFCEETNKTAAATPSTKSPGKKDQNWRPFQLSTGTSRLSPIAPINRCPTGVNNQQKVTVSQKPWPASRSKPGNRPIRSAVLAMTNHSNP